MSEATLDAWLARIEQYHPSDIELGLARLQHVWQRMDCPVNAKVITVAGTNGKGSTCAYIDALLTAHGQRVGRYGSPHFLRFNERMLVGGVEVSDEQLVEAFAAVDQARQETPLTYFEFTTLAAFYVFSQAKLDVWVLEVGLGGRLDAVNIIDPDVAVLTSVGLDHQAYLGDSIEAIGHEKAGVARANKPFVVGMSQPPMSVRRNEHGAQMLLRDLDFFDYPTLQLANGQVFDMPESLQLPKINVVTALQAASCLIDLVNSKVAGALAAAKLTGRMQRIMLGEQSVLLDVAHNPQAAENLAWQLAGEPSQVVFAGLKDKDLVGVVNALSAIASGWHLAGLSSVPRGLSSESLQAIVQLPDARLYPSPEAALAGAIASGENVLVCGSFFTVSAALSWLKQQTNV